MMNSRAQAYIMLNLSYEEWEKFCQKNHIQKISLYGSMLRGDFKEKSDIDLLVEFEPDQEPNLITLSGMELELEDRLGRPVDIRTPEDLSRYFRNEVLDSAEILYEKK